MRFAGDTFSRSEPSQTRNDDESVLSAYFPDLRKVYKPKFKAKAATTAATGGNTPSAAG